MARNWTYSVRKSRALRALDLALAPLSLATRLRRRRPIGDSPRILVLEFWHLGDAVMAEPLLRGLRARFPRAEISLLCKPHARTLLEPSGLVDRFIEIDLPWTAFTNKYELRRYLEPDLIRVIRGLRRERYDATIDARKDARSNMLTWLIGARHRVGFATPGAHGLLTHAVATRDDNAHKVRDWLAMLEPFGPVPVGGAPMLRVDPGAQSRADAHLTALGITGHAVLVAVHPSAGQAVKRWPLDRFATVVRTLTARSETQVIAIVGPDDYGSSLSEAGALCVRPSLEDLPGYLNRCDLFVGNDTGPAHIAAAVGTPTITVFGPGVAAWYSPLGKGHRVVKVEPMPCRPCFDSCTRSTNVCLQELSTDTVMAAVDDALAGMSRPPKGCVDADYPASEISV